MPYIIRILTNIFNSDSKLTLIKINIINNDISHLNRKKSISQSILQIFIITFEIITHIQLIIRFYLF